MKNVQWKYQNNNVIVPGYVKGEVTQDDCLKAGSTFYIAAIPEGSIVKSVTIYPTGDLEGVEDAIVKVDIGVNDCVFCPDIEANLVNGLDCNTKCSCVMTGQAYPVRLTLDNDIPVGGVIVLVEIINPMFQSGCAIDPIDICTKTVMVEPCTTDSACGCDAGKCVDNVPVEEPVDIQVVVEAGEEGP